MKNRYEQTTATAGNLQQRQVSEYRSRLRPSSFTWDALAWIVICGVLVTALAYPFVNPDASYFARAAAVGAAFSLGITLYRMLVWDRERVQSERDAEYRPVQAVPEDRVRTEVHRSESGSYQIKVGNFKPLPAVHHMREFACNALDSGKLRREDIPVGMFKSLNNRYGTEIEPEFQRLGWFDERKVLTPAGREAMEVYANQ